MNGVWQKFRGLKTWQQVLAVVFVVGALSSPFTGSGTDQASTDATATPSATASQTPTEDPMPDVPWADYAASVKTRIDGYTAAADCTSLQTEFDQADANNESTRNRTGHSNTDLMNYIDESMRRAACY